LDAVASFIGVSGKIHNISTKDFLSDFLESKPKRMVDFPKIIGKRLSIDETFLSNGETYTILTNKEAKKRTIVAIIAETKGDVVIY
jgi:hypothetical protein